MPSLPRIHEFIRRLGSAMTTGPAEPAGERYHAVPRHMDPRSAGFEFPDLDDALIDGRRAGTHERRIPGLVDAWRARGFTGATFTPLQPPTPEELKDRFRFINSLCWTDKAR